MKRQHYNGSAGPQSEAGLIIFKNDTDLAAWPILHRSIIAVIGVVLWG